MNDKLKKLVDSLESFGMSIPAHEKNAALIQQYADEQAHDKLKERDEELGLLKISLDNEKGLRESCEKALTERDTKLKERDELLAEMACSLCLLEELLSEYRKYRFPQSKLNDLGAGQEKQSGLTENEILKSPLSESQKKWVLTKPLFMIQGKRDDQLTDSELIEKRAWLEIHQAQKSQEKQPDETQEEEFQRRAACLRAAQKTLELVEKRMNLKPFKLQEP